jgi:hypothetical protein
MASRADRLPALRRLAADPGATPAERAAAARFAARLDPDYTLPNNFDAAVRRARQMAECARMRSTPRAPISPPARGVVLDAGGKFPWLRWRCPVCQEPVAHPGKDAGRLLGLAHCLATDENARRCLFCGVYPTPLTLDGVELPGAVPDALWRVAARFVPPSDFLMALTRLRTAYTHRDLWSSRAAFRRRIAAALDEAVAAGVLVEAPEFQIRAALGEAVVRWRRPR